MSPKAARLSLARWQRRLRYRERRYAKAVADTHKGVKGAPERKAKWSKLVKEARAMVRRRERQIKPRLRLRAWNEMAKLVALKVTESGGNNHGPMVEKIIRANGGTPGEPWCGDTVAYCYIGAGSKSVVRAWASVSWIERLLTRCYHPKRGHIVTYTFSHTGLFDRWAPEHGPGYFWAGEGNTGNSGAQSDSVTGGDGVKLKLRHVSLVSSFRKVLR
jgi:hypothetical protein